MSKRILSILFAGLLLFSCKENNAEPVQEQETTPTETVATPATEEPVTQTIETTENTPQVEIVQPAAPANTGPIIQQQQQQAPTTGQTAPGWSGKPNPPHGQEGHRCDIQVGAILP